MPAILEQAEGVFNTKTLTVRSPLPIIVGSAFAALSIHLLVPINHDVAWIMEGAQRLLDGGRFGRDIIDMNPPLAWWLSTVPAELAQLTGMGITAALTLFVIAVGLAGIGLTAKVLSGSQLSSTVRCRVLSALAVIGFIGPGMDFGQREHLMMFFSMPYVATAACRLNKDAIPWGRALVVGVFSAIGLCLKPYFLALPLFIEILIAVRSQSLMRWVRMDFLMIPAVGLLYLAAVFVYAPDYLYSDMPDAITNYWAYNDSFWSVLLAVLAAFGVSFLAYFLASGRGVKSASALTIALFTASAASALAALLQMKMWSYHLEPISAFGAIAFFSYVPAFKARDVRGLVHKVLPLVVVLSTCVGGIMQVVDVLRPNGTAATVNKLTSVFERFAGPGGYVYAVSTLVQDVHPAVVASGAHWSARMGCLYLLPAAFQTTETFLGDQPRIREAAQREVRQVVADLERKPPAVILVDDRRTRNSGATGDDYLDYLNRNAGFRHLWRQYLPHGSAGQFKVFVRRNRARDIRD